MRIATNRKTTNHRTAKMEVIQMDPNSAEFQNRIASAHQTIEQRFGGQPTVAQRYFGKR